MRGEGLIGWLLLPQESIDIEYTRGVLSYLVNFITANHENQVCLILDAIYTGRVPAEGDRDRLAGGVCSKR